MPKLTCAANPAFGVYFGPKGGRGGRSWKGGGGGSINRKVIAKTALSWVLTVPIAAFTTSALYGIILSTILDLKQ